MAEYDVTSKDILDAVKTLRAPIIVKAECKREMVDFIISKLDADINVRQNILFGFPVYENDEVPNNELWFKDRKGVIINKLVFSK